MPGSIPQAGGRGWGWPDSSSTDLPADSCSVYSPDRTSPPPVASFPAGGVPVAAGVDRLPLPHRALGRPRHGVGRAGAHLLAAARAEVRPSGIVATHPLDDVVAFDASQRAQGQRAILVVGRQPPPTPGMVAARHPRSLAHGGDSGDEARRHHRIHDRRYEVIPTPRGIAFSRRPGPRPAVSAVCPTVGRWRRVWGLSLLPDWARCWPAAPSGRADQPRTGWVALTHGRPSASWGAATPARSTPGAARRSPRGRAGWRRRKSRSARPRRRRGCPGPRRRWRRRTAGRR